jgi:hypothetical protein
MDMLFIPNIKCPSCASYTSISSLGKSGNFSHFFTTIYIEINYMNFFNLGNTVWHFCQRTFNWWSPSGSKHVARRLTYSP